MNLLRTIVSSLVNKNYYVVVLFLFSLLFLRILYFPCYVRTSLKILKKFPRIFLRILCRMDKWNLFLSTNVLSFDVLTILIHHLVLFFSIISQKEKFCVKKKNNTQSSCMIFFLEFYVGWTYTLRGSLFIKVVSQ